MELIGLLFIVFLVVIALKVFFNVAIFAITLPFKLLGLLLAGLFCMVFIIPFGIFAGLLGLLLAPLIILVKLAPLLLIVFGIYLLVKHSQA